MVHLHQHKTNEDGTEEEHHHISISSLRSKFENMAHDTHGSINTYRNKESTSSRPSTRPTTPSLGGPSALAKASMSTTSVNSETTAPQKEGSSVTSNAGSRPVTPSTRPPPPIVPKPDLRPSLKPDVAENAQPSLPSLTPENGESAAAEVVLKSPAAPTSSGSATSSALQSTATAASGSPPSEKNSVPSVSITGVNVSSSPSGSDDDKDHLQSVQALRERFGSTAQSAARARPMPVSRPSVEALMSRNQPSSSTSQPAPAATLPASSTLVSAAGPSTSSLGPAARSPAARSPVRIPTALPDEPPSASPAPAPTPEKPPAPPPKTDKPPAPVRPVAAAPILPPKPAPASAELAQPVAQHPKVRGPAPAPPIARTASPQPIEASTLSTSPMPSAGMRTASPAHRPAPPPPKRIPSPSSSVNSTEPVVKSAPASINVAASPRPPLPQRKPTVAAVDVTPPTPVGASAAPLAADQLPPRSVDASLAYRPPLLPKSKSTTSVATQAQGSSPPPPLPGNKPTAATLTASVPYAVRSRALSVSKNAPPSSSTPPRLPKRQATVHGEYQPPPPPSRKFAAAAAVALAGASLKRGNTVSSPGTGGYAAPPRRGSEAAPSSASMKKNASTETWSDDEGDEGPTQPLSSMAQRLLDEHPNATQANRRPPQFVPDIRIATHHSSISAYAVFGRWACVAHHHVRVYDTQMGSETPILEVDPRDTGLEFRAKEPRITAMGFRPSYSTAHEGRYLWCGNKDGHIWELDIKTGEVTASKAFVHAAAVTHILRHEKFIVTIDETGKINVWEVLEGEEGRGSANFRVIRTQRISDKITFAKMIKGKLWTATAPAVRSTTNASGARGPTVRVYEPCALGTVPPVQTILTTEWTGSATSATIMPMNPEVVFIGHEGGFVSVWGAGDQIECLQVLKISQTDILALEGVGERLWAGNRRGQIHVFDISEKPWLTTNIWTASPDQPVIALLVDSHSIELNNRFALWSVSRDMLRAWDGLLAVDWIDTQMVERQPEYCDFRELQTLVCSWNIDSAKPTDLSGSIQNAQFLEELINSVNSPDIIVFGFQEVIPLTDKKLTAKTLLFGSKGKEGGATSDRISGAYRAWADKLTSAVRQATHNERYYMVHSEQLVGLFTCMFVKESQRDSLRDVSITTVKRGIGGIYGNKGAIVARMVVDDTSICFINVHLAAGQRSKSARNADIAAILEDKAIFPPADQLPYVHGGDGTGILDHEMVVLNGDLNYRIDQRREVVVASVQSGDLPFLLEHDQLRKEMRTNHAFRLRSFAEAPIHFAPTYKYDRGTDEYDSSEKRRIPAWCDRVLYTKTPRIKPLEYRRYETNVSDHKPVSAALAMNVKRVDPTRMREVSRAVMQGWGKREGEMLAQMAKAYSVLY